MLCMGIFAKFFPNKWEKLFSPVIYKMFCIVKGTVQRDFRPPVFLLFEPAWATDQWVKYFRFLFRFR